jgi:transposase
VSGTDLKVSRDRGFIVEPALYDYLTCFSSASSGGSVEAVSVAGLGSTLGAAGAAACRSAAPLSLAGQAAPSAAGLSGGDPVRALHGHALVGGALPRAGLAERGDLSAPAGGVVGAGTARAGAPHLAGAAGRSREARLVAGDRRCLARGGKKGGAKVARTFRGSSGSRYHLAVDARGAPLAVRLSAGNENERRHLLPLVDALLARGIRPGELWADRGYDSRALEQALRERQIEPRISKRRRAGAPIPAGQLSREVWRGKRRQLATRDPQGRHRWAIERTNAWLKAKRRIATRRDVKDENYLAFLRLGMIHVLATSF